jgi:hypothetical protein
MPASDNLGTKRTHCKRVSGHGMIREVTTDYATQPRSLLWNGLVPTSLQLDFGLVQLGPHAFCHRVARKQKLTGPGFPANVGEAEKVECFRFPRAALELTLVGVLSKHQQSRLVRMELQAELLQSFSKFGFEALGGRILPESGYGIISVTHDNHLVGRMPLTPSLDPEVVDVVQVDVRQQTRYCRTLWRPLLGLRPFTIQ